MEKCIAGAIDAISPISIESDYPKFRESIPALNIREGNYLLRFAQSSEDLDWILRLRFEVFNQELGEGLASSYRTGRDWDKYDFFCHHLMLIEIATGAVIGTYRMQTGRMAVIGSGFYSGEEFDLSGFPQEVFDESVELGRACIAVAHRNTNALYLLWKGIAAYVAYNQKRFLFGCCSLTSQDPLEGERVFNALTEGGHLHPRFFIYPHPALECMDRKGRRTGSTEGRIPRLFRTYLRFGAKVCGPPAIDRSFNTIDYLVIFDIFEMDRNSHRMFFDAA